MVASQQVYAVWIQNLRGKVRVVRGVCGQRSVWSEEWAVRGVGGQRSGWSENWAVRELGGYEEGHANAEINVRSQVATTNLVTHEHDNDFNAHV